MIDLKIDNLKTLLKDPGARRYIIGGSLAFIAFIYFILIVVPGFNELFKVSRESGDLRSRVETARKMIDRIDARRGKLAELNKELGKHAKHLPAQKEITALLGGFSSIAKDSNIQILSIIPYDLKAVETDGKQDEYYREMPIQVKAKGGYHQLGTFITRLEQEKRVIVIDGVEIRYDKNTPRLHDIEMMVKTYVSLEDQKKK